MVSSLQMKEEYICQNMRFCRSDLVSLCDDIGKVGNTILHDNMNQIGFHLLDLSVLHNLPLYLFKLRW